MDHMERVLDFYAEPYDPGRPVVCLDGTSTQFVADVRPSTAAGPGQARREDCEYLPTGPRG